MRLAHVPLGQGVEDTQKRAPIGRGIRLI